VLPRAERLRRRRDFAATYARKKSWASPLLVLYVRRYPGDDLAVAETRRFGFVVSKKVAKKAVVRNRIKRRLRAICRRHGPEWRRGFDAILVVRSASVAASYADLDATVAALVGRANLLASATGGVAEGT